MWPKKAMRVMRSWPGLLVVMAGTAVLTVVAFSGPARRVELVDHSLMSRFLADQRALDRFPSTAQGLQQIEDENLAEGDGLVDGMVTAADATEAELVPAEFDALTVNV